MKKSNSKRSGFAESGQVDQGKKGFGGSALATTANTVISFVCWNSGG